MDPLKKQLVFKAGYGLDDRAKEAVEKGPFPLSEPNPLVEKVFYGQKPLFFSKETGSDNRPDSSHAFFTEKLKSRSLVCVPIVYKSASMGILLADNIRSSRPVTQSDVSLFAGIASQIAVGITSARAFQKLSESEERYRLLADNVSDIIWVLDPKTEALVYVSPAIRRMLGFSPEEAMAAGIKKSLDVDDYARMEKALEDEVRLAEKGRNDFGKIRTFSIRLRHKDGRFVFTETTARVIRTKEDGFIRFLGITRDITKRRQSEQERKQLEDRLKRAEKMEALGTLAGGVAHDLNNILSSITGYPELLLLDLPPQDPLRKPIEAIYRSGQKAVAVVQDLLTLARRGVAVKESVDLSRIAREYFDSPEHRKLAQSHPHVLFKTNLAPNLLKIAGSRLHLFKTVMNLVYNSAEAIPHMGEVEVSTGNRYLDTAREGFDAIASGDYVRLTVADSGMGIESKDLDNIFEPFYTKKKMGRSGTGLGMSVVWGTVKDHEGYIDVDSNPGKGTVFTLYFPAARDLEGMEPEKPEIRDVKGSGQAVLVVDDVPEQRDLAKEMLTRLNYKVTVAEGGKKALDLIADAAFDLVVLDMIMPDGMSGLETYREIIKIRPGQKAIIASGYSETDQVKTARKMGVGAYIKKPYTLEKIGLAVKKELER